MTIDEITVSLEFSSNGTCSFLLEFDVFIKDDLYCINVSVCPYVAWYNGCEEILCIPLAHISTNVKRVAPIIKRVFAEYIKHLYIIGKNNFKKSKQNEYHIGIGNENITYKWLRNRILWKYLKLMKAKCNPEEFCISDKFRDIFSIDIREPFHYTELVHIKEDYPVIYSLLEANDQLFSKYRILRHEHRELTRIYTDDTLTIPEFNATAILNMEKLNMAIDVDSSILQYYKVDIPNLSTLLEYEQYQVTPTLINI